MRQRIIRGEAGIGMTELAVAIVLFGLVVIGLAPIIVNSIGLAQNNSELGQANRIVSTQLDASRLELAGEACAPETSEPLTLNEHDDEMFVAERTVACNAANTLATVTVEVKPKSDTTRVLSTATTQVVTT